MTLLFSARLGKHAVYIDFLLVCLCLLPSFMTTGVVTTFAGSTMSLTSGNINGIGTMATFLSPDLLTITTSGLMYVADAGNNEIRLITPGGTVLLF